MSIKYLAIEGLENMGGSGAEMDVSRAQVGVRASKNTQDGPIGREERRGHGKEHGEKRGLGENATLVLSVFPTPTVKYLRAGLNAGNLPTAVHRPGSAQTSDNVVE